MLIERKIQVEMTDQTKCSKVCAYFKCRPYKDIEFDFVSCYCALFEKDLEYVEDNGVKKPIRCKECTKVFDNNFR